jgi:hypothetical protein
MARCGHRRLSGLIVTPGDLLEDLQTGQPAEVRALDPKGDDLRTAESAPAVGSDLGECPNVFVGGVRAPLFQSARPELQRRIHRPTDLGRLDRHGFSVRSERKALHEEGEAMAREMNPPHRSILPRFLPTDRANGGVRAAPVSSRDRSPLSKRGPEKNWMIGEVSRRPRRSESSTPPATRRRTGTRARAPASVLSAPSPLESRSSESSTQMGRMASTSSDWMESRQTASPVVFRSVPLGASDTPAPPRIGPLTRARNPLTLSPIPARPPVGAPAHGRCSRAGIVGTVVRPGISTANGYLNQSIQSFINAPLPVILTKGDTDQIQVGPFLSVSAISGISTATRTSVDLNVGHAGHPSTFGGFVIHLGLLLGLVEDWWNAPST